MSFRILALDLPRSYLPYLLIVPILFLSLPAIYSPALDYLSRFHYDDHQALLTQEVIHIPTKSHPTPPPPPPQPNMAWRCTGSSNADLISNLFRAHLITSPHVRNAMSAVDRAHYCPHPSTAYEDSPQPIGHGATISAPHMHASAAESLLPYIIRDDPNVKEDEYNKTGQRGRKVLDVGSGSGYLVHVFAHLVPDHPESKVVGIDHIQPLVDLAKQNMQKSESGRRFLDSGRVEIVKGDGRKGYPSGGPYDAIHVGAAASEIHKELIEQLNSPGRLFIPVEDGGGGGFFGGSQYIWVVEKDANGKVTKRRDMGVRYVPLTDAPGHER